MYGKSCSKCRALRETIEIGDDVAFLQVYPLSRIYLWFDFIPMYLLPTVKVYFVQYKYKIATLIILVDAHIELSAFVLVTLFDCVNGARHRQDDVRIIPFTSFEVSLS
jgi:hypothetical protein